MAFEPQKMSRTGRRLGYLTVAAVVAPVHAHASEAEADAGAGGMPAVRFAAPDWSSELDRDQQAVVDVYFGGKRIGDARVSFRSGSLTFEDVAELVSRIPGIRDPQAVTAALAMAELPAHAGLACSRGADPATCGRLTPDVAGVIFSEDRFRVDLFVNPQFLEVRELAGPKYLPMPERGLSMIDSFGAVLSGSSRGEQYYNLRNRLVVGEGNRRLRAEMSYATGFGVQAERLNVEIDKPGWRMLGGAFWAPGSDLIDRRKMIGVGIETQTDTRVDRDSLRGDPIVVFLAQRSRVDVVREGKVIGSRIYDAGNQALDTSGMPDGSYEVVLRIEDASGGRREERRFFSKNPFIPAVGQKVLYAYGGVLVDDLRPGFLHPTGKPFVQAGGALRLGRHLAIDVNAVLLDRTAMGQAGINFIGKIGQFRLAGLAASDGSAGALARVGSSGNSRLNFNLDARYISVRQASSRLPQPEFGKSNVPEVFTPRRTWSVFSSPTSYVQLNGNMSYSLPRGNFMLSGTFTRNKGQRASYSFGPSANYEILRRGSLRLSASAQYAFTDRGRTGLVGLTLQVLGRNSTLSASAGAETSSIERDRYRTTATAALRGSWQGDDVAGGELQLAGGYERNLDRNSIDGSVGFRSRVGRFQADVLHSLKGGSGGTDYSLGFETTLAVRGGAIALQGKQQNDSAVVVGVDGPAAKGRFEVLVNDSPVGRIAAGGRMAVTLNPYRQYDVRIRSMAGELLQYDSTEKRVSLFPGTVARLSWAARPVVAMFGQLVGPTGTPLANVSLSVPGGIGRTDGNGYFEIEAPEGATIEVKLPGGGKCSIGVPNGEVRDGFLRLGTLYCQPDRMVQEQERNSA